jgi:general secretion pathway protein G
MDTGSYPTTKQGLSALREQPDGVPNWKGPYVKNGAKLQDPWGRDYNYAFPGRHNGQDKNDCWTSGQDGISGTPDDVGNWPL